MHNKPSPAIKESGWFELVEIDFSGESPNGPVMRQIEMLMNKFLDLGMGFTYARSLRTHAEKTELEDMHDITFNIEYGAVCADKNLRAKGVSTLITTVRGIMELLRGNLRRLTAEVYEALLICHRPTKREYRWNRTGSFSGESQGGIGIRVNSFQHNCGMGQTAGEEGNIMRFNLGQRLLGQSTCHQ